ncbi:hypothetical protein MASR2M66_23760 [Chloroflexota bacterium]
MASIYSFWTDLFYKKYFFKQTVELVDFPFNEEIDLISSQIVQLKESDDYDIAPFISNPPVGRVEINGEEVDRYYLVRGYNSMFQKVCLVHGSFFETVPAEELVSEVYSQILDEGVNEFTESEKEAIKKALPLQKIFSRTIGFEKSSVTLQYQLEFEVKPDANILSPKQYPEILDDTLNLICPFHSEDEKEELISNVASVVGLEQLEKLNVFPIKHPLNGWFLVFQTRL